MLMAKNSKDNWVRAHDVVHKNEGFYCPDCHEPVTLRKGSYKIAHFAHRTRCTQQRFSEGETSEHLTGKALLLHWLQQQEVSVVLEAYLPDLHQRPDLLVTLPNGKRVAIELQCSPIVTDCFVQRTNGYVSKGYDVLWIVGSKNSALSKSVFAYLWHDVQLFYLDVSNERLYAKSSGGLQRISIDQLLSQSIPQCPIAVTRKQFKAYEWRRVVSQNSLKWFYANRLAIDTLPKVLFGQAKRYIGLRQPFPDILCWVYGQISARQQCDVGYLVTVMKTAVKLGVITLSPMPLIAVSDYCHHLVTHCVTMLRQLQLVVSVGDMLCLTNVKTLPNKNNSQTVEDRL